MKLFVALMLALSSSAFASDKLTFDASFDLPSCYAEYGSETCDSTTTIHVPDPDEDPAPVPKQSIILTPDGNGTKSGSLLLTAESDEGTFSVLMTVTKFPDHHYQLDTTFTDPDGFESYGAPFEFTKLYQLDLALEGDMWGTDAGYLLPTLTIHP